MKLSINNQHISAMLFIVISLLCPIMTLSQDIHTQKHHVIILIDRSAGMQQEKQEETLGDVFNYINEICFRAIDSAVGRSLLKPDFDCLTVASYGLNNLDQSIFESFVHTQVGSKNFGYLFNSQFKNNVIFQLENTIRNIGQNTNLQFFFNLSHAFPTAALPIALNYINSRNDGQRYERTFVIELSDKVKNVKGIGAEISCFENETRQQLIKNNNSYKNGFKDLLIGDLNKAFPRQASQAPEKGDKYFVSTTEIIPSITGISIESLIDFERPIYLNRYPKGYHGKLKYSLTNSKQFILDTLYINSFLNDKIIHSQQVSFNSIEEEGSVLIDLVGVNYNDDCRIEVSTKALYNNSFYTGTTISSEQYPHLSNRVEYKLEKVAKILWIIPVGNKLFRILPLWGHQKATAAVISILIILLVVGLYLFVIWLYFKNGNPVWFYNYEIKIK
jgi:hypothetical protein